MKTNYLFVYGTLMKSSEHAIHPLLKPHCQFISRAWMLGKLYQIAHYPGVIESHHKHERVYGELYEFTNRNQVFAQLDDYEECSSAFPSPHEYLRKQVRVYLSETDTQYAWTYIYNHPVHKNNRILSGDFTKQ